MRLNPDIAFDLHQGEVRLGSRRVRATVADSHGALRLFGLNGPVIRPLTFGERNILAAQAAMSSAPERHLADAVGRAAIVIESSLSQNGDNETLIQAVALALAGGHLDAPGFDHAAIALGKAGGWTLADISNTLAIEVDRLADSLAPGQWPESMPNGWRRIVLAEDPADGTAPSDLVLDMAARLLGRLRSAIAGGDDESILSLPSGALADDLSIGPVGDDIDQSSDIAFQSPIETARHSAQPADKEAVRPMPGRKSAGLVRQARWRIVSASLSQSPQAGSPAEATALSPVTAPSRTTPPTPRANDQAAPPISRDERQIKEERSASAPRPSMSPTAIHALQPEWTPVAPSIRDEHAWPATGQAARSTMVNQGASQSGSPASRPAPVMSTAAGGGVRRLPADMLQAAPIVSPVHLGMWADDLAQALDDEADLRGLHR